MHSDHIFKKKTQVIGANILNVCLTALLLTRTVAQGYLFAK